MRDMKVEFVQIGETQSVLSLALWDGRKQRKLFKMK